VVEGLQPGREYFYRFATRTASSPVGRFRTLAGDSADPVRIGFFSCQDYQAGYYTAHAGLAAEQDLDLIVCLGDYIYERSYYEGPRKDTTGANGDADVQSLAEYRQKYALYRSDPLLQAMHASAPFVAVWDDHEIEDNWAGENPGHATPEDQRRSDFLTRRTAGRRAFFEWMPRLRRREEVDRIYGGVPLGANAELILLDTRSYRDAQPCGDQLIVPCPDAETGARKLLGDAQKQWFVDRVAGSTARWKVVGNQIMVMSLDSAPSVTLNVDAWDGYGAERAEVLQALAGRGVQDLTFITGDIHTFFAGTVHQNGRVATPAIGTEFVGGSITSHGLEDYFAGPLANAGEQGVRANNPHVHFSNFRARGYGVLEARPDELRVTFRSPSTVMEPTAPVSDLAAFRVAAGSTVVETA
jgi:alkaline phosphatase D